MLTNLRMLKLLPLTFIAGEEGFALVAPYVLVMFALLYTLRQVRAMAPSVSSALLP